jgi:hypothetical protein
LLVEGVHVIGESGVGLDGLTRLLVDVSGESMALFGCIGLLVTKLPAVVVRQRRGRARPLSVVCLEVPLVDAPVTPRRNARVVGLDCVLLESAVAGEVAGILTEDPLVEVPKGQVAVDILGNDPAQSSSPRSPAAHSTNRSSSRAAFRR